MAGPAARPASRGDGYRNDRARERNDNRRRAARRPARPAYAAVDLGTNNCRLLVAEPSARGFRVIDSFSRIVRLGEGVAATGRLSEPAIDRTIDALRICAAKMRRADVVRVRNVATAACRQAANCDRFVARARTETGLDFEIISAAEEARLALTSCAPLFDPAVPGAIVFDIGGGSTEIVCRPDRDAPVGVLSLPLGVVNLSERYGGDRIPADGYRQMVEEAAALLAVFERDRELRPRIAAGQMQMVGSSGTVTTLASIHLGLRRYVRSRIDGATVRFDDLLRIGRMLAGMSRDERAAVAGIGAARADLVVGGVAILEAIVSLWPVGRMRIADRGLREGILLGLMAQDGHPVCARMVH